MAFHIPQELPGLEYSTIIDAWSAAQTGDPAAVYSWIKLANARPDLARIAPHVTKAFGTLAAPPGVPAAPDPLADPERIVSRAARQLDRERKRGRKQAQKAARRKLARVKAAYAKGARQAAQDAYAAGQATASVTKAAPRPSGPCPCVECFRARTSAEMSGATVLTKSAGKWHASGRDQSAYAVPLAPAVIDYRVTEYDADPRRRELAWNARERA